MPDFNSPYVRNRSSKVVHVVSLASDRAGRTRTFCRRAFGSAFDREAVKRIEHLDAVPDGQRLCKTCVKAKANA